MKKYIGLFLAFVIATSSVVSSSAKIPTAIIGGKDAATQIYVSSDYMSLEDALISVKQKVNVPLEFTDFESRTEESERGIRYNFSWSNKDGDTIAISCDGQAHIHDYEYYSQKLYKNDGGMILFKRKKAQEFAVEFLKQIFPEGFINENDTLVYNDEKSSSYKSSYGTRFNLVFDRKKDNIKVKDNLASVYVLANSEGMTITFVTVNFDLVKPFGENKEVAENIKDAYVRAYPMELVYESEYNYRSAENNTKLIYRFADNNYGYIMASDGSKVEIDKETELNYAGGLKEEAADSAISTNRSELTEEEINEIEKNKNLISPNKAEQILKSVAEFKINSNFSLKSSSVYKNNECYMINTVLENEGQYIYATLDASTGQILSFNGISNYEDTKEITERDTESAKKAIEGFLGKYATSEFKESEFLTTSLHRANVTFDFVRIVNGIKYINNGISLTYDTKNNKIVRYALNFDKNKEFENVDKAVDIQIVYDNVLDFNFIPVYAPINGKYELCYTVDGNGIIKVDALTGKLVLDSIEKFEYTDIENHWCNDAVILLSEYGIGINSNEFEPEKQMTQEELLRFIANALYSRSYSDTELDMMYDDLILQGIIKEDEKNPTSKVMREEAFKYFTRVAGYGRIGEISGIYKVNFKDSENISKDYIGYAAILSGLNVISGHNGNLRPTDYITRAETAVMTYNYLNCDK